MLDKLQTNDARARYAIRKQIVRPDPTRNTQRISTTSADAN